MWKRFERWLHCPICHDQLELDGTEERRVTLDRKHHEIAERLSIPAGTLNVWIESGAMVCKGCCVWYPITHGLPVLIPYRTAIAEAFRNSHPEVVSRFAGYKTAAQTPRPGEEFVSRTFSKEWLEYTYDGVIWGWSYEDRERTLLTELGLEREQLSGVRYLEIGCGLGITTQFAHKNFEADAVGVDLSLAVLKASQYYREHPFLHFVNATLFQLPFQTASFDLVYSHGVIHHTFSTRDAFAAIAPFCKPGGLTYIWVYGTASQTDGWGRRLAHYAETLLRPILSRIPVPVATTVLAPIAIGYTALNAVRRMRSPDIQPYDFRRGLHAARDRFTPMFAHRHDRPEVERWFRELGFENIEELDWRAVPPAVHTLYRRCTGVRGRRALSPGGKELPADLRPDPNLSEYL